MPPFAADIRHWPTLASFEAHLAAHDPAICAWVAGLTYHHTYRPTLAQWRGAASMRGMQAYYVGKGWPSGPHLYIAPDGIWQMTPLNLPGTHATVCNPHTWGVEVVGDYDLAPWPPIIRDLALGVGVALLRWRGLSPETVRGHRDCNSPKSCPGRAVSMQEVRRLLGQMLAAPQFSPIPLIPSAAIMAPPRCTLEQAHRLLVSRATGEYTSSEIALRILPPYWDLCERAGVDPCVAVAQLIHETGNLTSWWAARPRRNPAGIGVTGQTRPFGGPAPTGRWASDGLLWREGVSFLSWDAAIVAHVGRLVAYATKPSDRTAQQTHLVNEALRVRPLATDMHGIAPTVGKLGGTWAVPGAKYGQKLVEIMERMRGVAA